MNTCDCKEVKWPSCKAHVRCAIWIECIEKARLKLAVANCSICMSQTIAADCPQVIIVSSNCSSLGNAINILPFRSAPLWLAAGLPLIYRQVSVLLRPPSLAAASMASRLSMWLSFSHRSFRHCRVSSPLTTVSLLFDTSSTLRLGTLSNSCKCEHICSASYHKDLLLEAIS